MSKLVLALAILALPGLTMAQPSMDVSQTVTKAPIIQYDPWVDTQIVIDVDLGPATAVNGGLQYSVCIDGQANDADWTLVNVVENSSLFPMGGAISSGLAGSPMNVVNGTTAEGYMAMMAYGPGAPIATWTLAGDNPVLKTKVGTFQMIQADVMVWPTNGVDGAPFAALGVPLQVDIVPEPTTALLLPGAIPFLRRRR